MDSFAFVMRNNFPGQTAHHVPNPESLRLITSWSWMECPQLSDELKEFAQSGVGVILWGNETSSYHRTIGQTSLGTAELRGVQQLFVPDYDHTYTPDEFLNEIKPRQIWCFSDGDRPPSLVQRLPMNAHFPIAEAALLPKFIEAKASEKDYFSGGATTIEEIYCSWRTVQALSSYCTNVPPAHRCLRRVVFRGDLANPNNVSPAIVAEELKPIYSERGSAVNSLVIDSATTDLLCEIIQANCPNLTRIVIDSWSNSGADFSKLLPVISENTFLKEFRFQPANCTMDGRTLQLMHKCKNVTFQGIPEGGSKPPLDPTEILTSDKELQQPLPLAEFNKLCKQEKRNPPIGLLTAYGQVVPLAKALVPRFQLLQDMLKENDGAENLVPMELDPPVGKESVALAVHFVTHCVSDEMHKECAEAESKRDAASADQEDSSPSFFSWCFAFAQFRVTFIQQRYATPQRRLHILCELMALAVFLNCPSLKRFLRAAFVMEDPVQIEGEESNRGKRNRDE